MMMIYFYLTVFELQVIGRLPFDDSNHKRLLGLILDGPKFPVNRDSTLEFQDLAVSILKRENARVSISDIRDSAWYIDNAS